MEDAGLLDKEDGQSEDDAFLSLPTYTSGPGWTELEQPPI